MRKSFCPTITLLGKFKDQHVAANIVILKAAELGLNGSAELPVGPHRWKSKLPNFTGVGVFRYNGTFHVELIEYIYV